MSDIAGLRVIVSNITNQNKAIEIIKSTLTLIKYMIIETLNKIIEVFIY